LWLSVGDDLSRDDFHSLGKRRLQLVELFFYELDDIEGILAGAHDDDAADGVSLTVQIGNAAANVGAQGDEAEILDQNRSPLRVAADDDLLDVPDVLDVPPAADHVLRTAELKEAAAHVIVAVPDRLDHRW